MPQRSTVDILGLFPTDRMKRGFLVAQVRNGNADSRLGIHNKPTAGTFHRNKIVFFDKLATPAFIPLGQWVSRSLTCTFKFSLCFH